MCIGLTIPGLIEAGRNGFAARVSRKDPAAPGPGGGDRPWLGLSVVVVLVVGHVLGSLVASSLTGTDHLTTLLRGELRALSLILPAVLAASLGTIQYFCACSRLVATELQVQAARRAAAEKPLWLLESPLEPHILFNSLADLRVPTAIDPPRAQAMLDRLIAFLRATLRASRSGLQTLAAEFGRLADCLALMAIRMGARLTTRLDLPEALRETQAPQLLLQPLVENGIQHGLEPNSVERCVRRRVGLRMGFPTQPCGYVLVNAGVMLALGRGGTTWRFFPLAGWASGWLSWDS